MGVRHVHRFEHRVPLIALHEDVHAPAVAFVAGGDLPSAAQRAHALGQLRVHARAARRERRPARFTPTVELLECRNAPGSVVDLSGWSVFGAGLGWLNLDPGDPALAPDQPVPRDRATSAETFAPEPGVGAPTRVADVTRNETDAPRSPENGKSRRPRRRCLDFSLLIGGTRNGTRHGARHAHASRETVVGEGAPLRLA